VAIVFDFLIKGALSIPIAVFCFAFLRLQVLRKSLFSLIECLRTVLKTFSEDINDDIKQKRILALSSKIFRESIMMSGIGFVFVMINLLWLALLETFLGLHYFSLISDSIFLISSTAVITCYFALMWKK
jgi:hypothetical protein